MAKRICIFGASITWGANDYEKGGWVNRLRFFSESKYGKENMIFNLGISGDCSKRILKRLENETLVRMPNTDMPNVIIFAFGNNDSRFNNIIEDSIETPIDEFRRNIKKLINIARKYSRDVLFVGVTPCNESLTTPTIWSKIEYFTNDSIRKYNNITKEICRSEKVPFSEQFDTWIKEDYKNLLDKKDGLHPNAQGHEKIFQRVKDFLINNKII